MAGVGDEVDAHLLGAFQIGQIGEQQQSRRRAVGIDPETVHMQGEDAAAHPRHLNLDDLRAATAENPANGVAGRRLTQELMDFHPYEAGTEARRGGAVGGLHTGARVEQNQRFGDGVENRPLQTFGTFEGSNLIAPQVSEWAKWAAKSLSRRSSA